MKILILAASAQRQSVNKHLAHSIELLMRTRGFEDIERPDFKSFTMPMYDGDLEQESGLPATTHDLAKHFQQADAIVICTPEYNGSIPGSLKNALDWVSRLSPHPLIGKPVLMTGASPVRWGRFVACGTAVCRLRHWAHLCSRKCLAWAWPPMLLMRMVNSKTRSGISNWRSYATSFSPLPLAPSQLPEVLLNKRCRVY